MTTKPVPYDTDVVLAAARVLYRHSLAFRRARNPRSKRAGEDLAAIATAVELAAQYPRLAGRQVEIAAGLAKHSALIFPSDTPIGHVVDVCRVYLENRSTPK